jgi:hypothetical protein
MRWRCLGWLNSRAIQCPSASCGCDTTSSTRAFTGPLLKLAAFVLVVSTLHDFVVGPRAVRAIARDPWSSETRTWRQRASLLGRANAGLGLLLVAAGVMLVRGALTW